jgi:hypothetical protein
MGDAVNIRLLRPKTGKRSGVPYITTTVRIYGEQQIATFGRLCEVAGRQPHELASDIILDEVWSLSGSAAFRKLAREQRQWRKGRIAEAP